MGIPRASSAKQVIYGIVNETSKIYYKTGVAQVTQNGTLERLSGQVADLAAKNPGQVFRGMILDVVESVPGARGIALDIEGTLIKNGARGKGNVKIPKISPHTLPNP